MTTKTIDGPALHIFDVEETRDNSGMEQVIVKVSAPYFMNVPPAVKVALYAVDPPSEGDYHVANRITGTDNYKFEQVTPGDFTRVSAWGRYQVGNHIHDFYHHAPRAAFPPTEFPPEEEKPGR